MSHAPTLAGGAAARRIQMPLWMGWLTVAACLVLPVVQAGPAAASARDEAAEHFVADLASKSLAILSDKGHSRKERVEEFRTLFVANTDLERFARSALGRRYVRLPTDEEFKEYLDALQDYAVEVLFAQFSLFADHSVKVTGSEIQKTASTTYVIVATDIIDPKRTKAAVVQWIMRQTEGTYKMFDVRVQSTDGSAAFSMLTTQRDEFTQVLNQNGGKMTGLIAYLRDGTVRIRERAKEREQENASVRGDDMAAGTAATALAR